MKGIPKYCKIPTDTVTLIGKMRHAANIIQLIQGAGQG
jgi:hypothetical protein